MKTRTFGFLLMLVFCARGILAQSQSGSAAPSSVVIKAGKLLDVRKGGYVENAAVWIDGERIKQVGAAAEIEAQAAKNAKVIDLGRATVLPGLIDCHTRIMARFDESENGYRNARITLEAGYTTIRDVEKEGSGYAEVALRDASSRAWP
jgi:imidazolonepropionase-like amidohydrolase